MLNFFLRSADNRSLAINYRIGVSRSSDHVGWSFNLQSVSQFVWHFNTDIYSLYLCILTIIQTRGGGWKNVQNQKYQWETDRISCYHNHRHIIFYILQIEAVLKIQQDVILRLAREIVCSITFYLLASNRINNDQCSYSMKIIKLLMTPIPDFYSILTYLYYNGNKDG
jgi:hypothetical protein